MPDVRVRVCRVRLQSQPPDARRGRGAPPAPVSNSQTWREKPQRGFSGLPFMKSIAGAALMRFLSRSLLFVVVLEVIASTSVQSLCVWGSVMLRAVDSCCVFDERPEAVCDLRTLRR